MTKRNIAIVIFVLMMSLLYGEYNNPMRNDRIAVTFIVQDNRRYTEDLTVLNRYMINELETEASKIYKKVKDIDDYLITKTERISRSLFGRRTVRITATGRLILEPIHINFVHSRFQGPLPNIYEEIVIQRATSLLTNIALSRYGDDSDIVNVRLMKIDTPRSMRWESSFLAEGDVVYKGR